MNINNKPIIDSAIKSTMRANEHIRVGSNSYEKVKTFKYLGSLIKNKNSIHEEIKCRFKAENSCHYSLLFSRLEFEN